MCVCVCVCIWACMWHLLLWFKITIPWRTSSNRYMAFICMRACVWLLLLLHHECTAEHHIMLDMYDKKKDTYTQPPSHSNIYLHQTREKLQHPNFEQTTRPTKLHTDAWSPFDSKEGVYTFLDGSAHICKGTYIHMSICAYIGSLPMNSISQQCTCTKTRESCSTQSQSCSGTDRERL